MIEHFGFGDFVFRMPDGREVGAGARSARARGAARDRAGREHRLPRRAQPLLELAQGAHRVRARRTSCGRARSRTSRPSRTLRARADARDPRVPPRTQPRRGGRLRPRRRSTRDATSAASAAARSAARRAASRSCDVLLSQSSGRATDSRRAHHRAAGGRARRPTCSTVPRRQRPARLRARQRRRRGDRAPVPSRPISRRRPSATWRRSSSASAIRWRCARRACSRTRSTSRSPASTRRTCCRTTRRAADCGCDQLLTRDQARLRVDVQPRAPRTTSAPRRTASKKRRWR